MDPNANLQEQEQIIVRNTGGTFAPQTGDRARLQELREELMYWLEKHGFEPQWSKYPKAARWFAGKGVGGSIPPELYGK